MFKWQIGIVIALLISIDLQNVHAQIYPNLYRPGIQWMELTTPHFQIIYPQGADSAAWRSARILETEYRDLKEYLPSSKLDDLPVILNNYNNRSNGFVTTLNFRMEVQLTPIKGKDLNPRTGGWLENVLPHELAHAMHFEVTPKGNLFTLLKPFSPDGIRSIHAAAPAGILEGIAVDHETHGVATGGGRGQYPYFSNQFNSVFNSSDRWSMPQMTFIPTVSRPFVRHYMGGYEFMHWLQEMYGTDITVNAVERHFERPFLFFGHALKRSTGRKSGELYDAFVSYKKKQLQAKSNKIKYHALPLNGKGASVRRPKWLSNDKLVFYGSFYNKRPGFYIYTLDSGKMELIKAISVTEDFRYHLDKERGTLTYGSYHADLRYDNVFKADLFRTDISSGRTKRITDNKQLYAPVRHNGRLWALRADGSSSKWVEIGEDEIKSVVESDVEGQIIAVEPNPVKQSLVAVVINKNGVQGLWVTDLKNIADDLNKPPSVAFENGSVFDPQWHPDGQRLMFSSDHSGVINLFEYDRQTQQLIQITNSTYNALEGAYNATGDKIVFSAQYKSLQKPVVLSRSEFYNREINSQLWASPHKAIEKINSAKLGYSGRIETDNWQNTPYRTGFSWLKPRAMVPVFRTEEEVYGFSFTGTDRLQRHTYNTEFTYGNSRAWYDITYRYSGFFPGFEVSVFDRVNNTVTLNTEAGPREFLFAEQGASLAIPIPVTLKQNVYNRSLFFRPEIEYRSVDLRSQNGGNIVNNDFIESTNLELFSVLHWNTQQNIRDMQPNTGWSLFTETDVDLFDSGSAQTDFGYRFRVGAYRYLSPLRSLNQLLRLGTQYFKVRNQFVFDDDLIIEGFDSDPIARLNEGLTFETRYLIPLVFLDNGIFGIPAFFDSFYFSLFSNTVFDLNSNSSGIGDFFEDSRSIYGFGLRARMKISNLAIDIGVGVSFEPTRNHTQAISDF